MNSPRMNSSIVSTTTTQTLQETQTQAPTEPALILSLRERPRISWSENTIDNEHMGKKSSKRCCIFHKVKKFGESDSDESDKEGDGGEDSDKSDDAGKQDASAGEEKKPKKKVVKNYQRHHA
jgi:protein phosphatase 1 regulatory subunit 11